MRTHTLRSLSALALALPATVAWAGASGALSLTAQSRLWVDGTSTVRSWSCKATTLDAELAAAPGAVGAIMGGQKAITAVSLDVPVAKLDCGNGTMNDHMRKALKADKAPVISFRLSSYDMTKAAAGMSGKLQGTLTIGGVTKPITLTATGTEENGALHVTGTHEVKMTEWSIAPPKLMMGTMKVGEVVKVGFDLYLKG